MSKYFLGQQHFEKIEYLNSTMFFIIQKVYMNNESKTVHNV